MSDLTRVGTWNVWVGDYSRPSLVVAPLDTELSEIGRLGKLALEDTHNESRGYNEEHIREQFAQREVTKIERGDNAYIDPRVNLL